MGIDTQQMADEWWLNIKAQYPKYDYEAI